LYALRDPADPPEESNRRSEAEYRPRWTAFGLHVVPKCSIYIYIYIYVGVCIETKCLTVSQPASRPSNLKLESTFGSSGLEWIGLEPCGLEVSKSIWLERARAKAKRPGIVHTPRTNPLEPTVLSESAFWRWQVRMVRGSGGRGAKYYRLYMLKYAFRYVC
jgi:hypothetical protein